MTRQVRFGDQRCMIRMVERVDYSLPGNVGWLISTDTSHLAAEFPTDTMGPRNGDQRRMLLPDGRVKQNVGCFHRRATIEPKDPSWYSG